MIQFIAPSLGAATFTSPPYVAVTRGLQGGRTSPGATINRRSTSTRFGREIFPFRSHQKELRATPSVVACSGDLVSSGSGEVATSVVNNSGLLVRGGEGGGGVIAAAPLGAALLAAACASAVVERRTQAGRVVGAPLLSFGVFCLLSNLELVPLTHAVYDLCWSFLLPLSLSVIILGNPVMARRRDGQNSGSAFPEGQEDATAHSCTTRGASSPMKRVGLSFLVGAAGSVAGVASAFLIATSSSGAAGGAFALPRDTAAQIAGAVTATYIGGSVNLFAVAAAVGLIGATSAGGASLLGALAASDIFLMALYFSGLVAAHKTPFLRRAFPAVPGPTGGGSRNGLSTLREGGGAKLAGPSVDAPRGRSLLSRSIAATLLCLLGLGSVICLVGNALASRSPLPGTSTMAVTLLTVAVARALSRVAPSVHADFARVGPAVATVLLNAFFGSIGASGRWAQVVGVAPAIFAFSSVALGVHVAVMVAGVAMLNRFCGVGLGIDDMIVASNANIGGPSTAATFAGLIGEDELVVPAAAWGTVGYAIATTLGVGVWTVLR